MDTPKFQLDPAKESHQMLMMGFIIGKTKATGCSPKKAIKLFFTEKDLPWSNELVEQFFQYWQEFKKTDFARQFLAAGE